MSADTERVFEPNIQVLYVLEISPRPMTVCTYSVAHIFSKYRTEHTENVCFYIWQAFCCKSLAECKVQVPERK